MERGWIWAREKETDRERVGNDICIIDGCIWHPGVTLASVKLCK